MNRLFEVITAFAFLALSSTTAEATVVEGRILYLGGPPVGSLVGSAEGPSVGDIVSTVDQIGFTVNTAGIIAIDTLSWERNFEDGSPTDVNGDGEIAFFDPYIYVFADDGSLGVEDLIDSNDDSSSTFGDGSISSLDSFLSVLLPVGDYILTIGGFNHTAEEAIAGANPGLGSGFYPVTWDGAFFYASDHGDYRITFTGDVSVTGVSEPQSIALLVIYLAGLSFARFRRQSASNQHRGRPSTPLSAIQGPSNAT